MTGGDGGWEINDHQLHPGSKMEGINITLETNRIMLVLNKEVLDEFKYQELPIRCFVHTTDPIRISFGNYIYVIRYGTCRSTCMCPDNFENSHYYVCARTHACTCTRDTSSTRKLHPHPHFNSTQCAAELAETKELPPPRAC